MENNEIIETFLEILDCEEFELVRYENGIWSLCDLQWTNLGGVENESYNTITDIIDRLSVYHEDYFERDIMEEFGIEEHNGYDDLIEKCKQHTDKEFYKEHEWELNALYFIAHCCEYEICNAPLEQIKDKLQYTQYDEDFVGEQQ